ncbi:hypothetical protein PG997_005350 [Apiospora hydei]|uniref:Uncharacterized protein n=1 Tax=Apiospora hydei TaxID=1337664 RepID=A0ABR1X4V4_9PEZI
MSGLANNDVGDKLVEPAAFDEHQEFLARLYSLRLAEDAPDVPTTDEHGTPMQKLKRRMGDTTKSAFMDNDNSGGEDSGKKRPFGTTNRSARTKTPPKKALNNEDNDRENISGVTHNVPVKEKKHIDTSKSSTGRYSGKKSTKKKTSGDFPNPYFDYGYDHHAGVKGTKRLTKIHLLAIP